MHLLWQTEPGENRVLDQVHYSFNKNALATLSWVHKMTWTGKDTYEVLDKKMNEELVSSVKREGLESESHAMVFWSLTNRLNFSLKIGKAVVILHACEGY